MDEPKPELDEYTTSRDLEAYADRLWQQRVKTERESAESDDDASGYSPSRENFYYDGFYTGETDTFREPLDYPLKRTLSDDPLSPSSSTPNVAVPVKRMRGRPYKEASVKITCLRPEDRLATTLTVDFNKLQEEELGVPKSELSGGLRSSSKLPLTWSADDLRRHILTLFPRVRNFKYMKCNHSKTLDPLPDDIKPADLRNLLGRSGLYIIPTGSLLPKGTTSLDIMVSSPEPCYSGVSSTNIANTANASSTFSNIDQSPTAGSVNVNKQYWFPVKVSGEQVISNDLEFRITLDISNFSPDEITLKTKNNRVVVHAKHPERVDEFGLIEREFKRQYILPKDVDPNEVTSSLSTNGILTMKAPKIDTDNGKERIIPIRFTHDDS
ncbi:hypothetical protein ACF0H5_003859 [Mactra antiquata]